MTLWKRIQELENAGRPFVLITLLQTRGQAPQDPGAKALITHEGLEFGTVGGGKVEAASIQYAFKLLETVGPTPPETVIWNLQRDIEMTCGGEVTLLFEKFDRQQWKIAIFGAGHVSQALVRALAPLNCQLICLDPRKEWTDKLPSSSNLDIVTSDGIKEIQNFSGDTFFVVITQGHSTDVPILEVILKKETLPPYFGVIGSETKGRRIKAELLERGVDPRRVEKLRCPIGLKLGSNHPHEIAISICAELIQERDLFFSQKKSASEENSKQIILLKK